MKDEDIKLPNMPFSLVNSPSYNNDIEEYARQAVRMNMPTSKTSCPEPFDLARAMAGEPIVTRAGRKARFVAHVPEASTFKVVVFVEGELMATNFTELGRLNTGDRDCHLDLFMAPKPKRTVWVNVWENRLGNLVSVCHETKEKALYCAQNLETMAVIKKAHPIEIDA